MKYEPTLMSVKKHEVPEWFHDAKFGIFIHWSISSVPAFAAIGRGDFNEIITKEGIGSQFKNNPYAEWYLNSMKIPGSLTKEYHLKTYGEDFKYEDFIPEFNKEIQKWNPEEWADLFKKAGARYVVLVTKHHDGFLLWPSEHPNPKRENYAASRDIVGELTSAVKKKNLKMGLYYSGALDWTFNEKPIKDVPSFLTNGPKSREYIDYVNAHWYELIDRYEPAILWNDIGYPPGTNVYKIFSYFYNKIDEGLVNDRWLQAPKWIRAFVTTWLGGKIATWVANRMIKKGAVSLHSKHFDYVTPEYTTFKEIKHKKWECTRGMGNSFGYNAQEPPNNYLTVEELVQLLVDIVSKNGNLLLNLGPMKDGTIPEIQKEHVLGLGAWLEKNGDAIFGTRPWVRAEGMSSGGIEVRFTQKGEVLYFILLGVPNENLVIIESIKAPENAKIIQLENGDSLSWNQNGENLEINTLGKSSSGPAVAFSMTPKPIQS